MLRRFLVQRNHLAVANMYGGHLRIYRLHEDLGGMPRRLELLHEKGACRLPEGITVSPDGSLLAAALRSPTNTA